MVVLTQPGKWVIGALANNIWSSAGDSDRDNVNLMTVQPFVNYNFGKGWYVSSSPIITANWAAHGSDNAWTVPVGGGFGRIIRIRRRRPGENAADRSGATALREGLG